MQGVRAGSAGGEDEFGDLDAAGGSSRSARRSDFGSRGISAPPAAPGSRNASQAFGSEGEFRLNCSTLSLVLSADGGAINIVVLRTVSRTKGRPISRSVLDAVKILLSRDRMSRRTTFSAEFIPAI